MADEITGIAPNPVHPQAAGAPNWTAATDPAGSLKPQPYAPNAPQQPSGSLSQAPKTGFFAPKPAEPIVPVVPEINHLEEIAALVRSLHNISPSGAQTVGGQILEHISALQVEADKTKTKVKA